MANKGLMVAIGLGKPKDKSGPPPPRTKPAVIEKTTEVVAPAKEPPTDSYQPQESETLGADPIGSDTGIGAADVDYSDNDLCESCANMGQDGTCTKYGFVVDPTGHCEAGFQPKTGGVNDTSTGDSISGGYTGVGSKGPLA